MPALPLDFEKVRAILHEEIEVFNIRMDKSDEKMDKMNEKVDSLLLANVRNESLSEQVKGHEKRITTLETEVALSSTINKVLVFVSGVLVSVFAYQLIPMLFRK